MITADQLERIEKALAPNRRFRHSSGIDLLPGQRKTGAVIWIALKKAAFGHRKRLSKERGTIGQVFLALWPHLTRGERRVIA